MNYSSNSTFTFLPEDSETADLFRSIDWNQHEMGHVDAWPQSLRTSLGILFHSRHPMFIWWGNDLIQFYNDAYLPSFRNGKHPTAMGQRGAECWPKILPIIYPQIQDVRQSKKASWNENQLVPIYRNGKLEDVYWTYGYSPILLESGEVGGVLVVCTETTQQVLAEKETFRAKQELQDFLTQAPVGIALLKGADHTYSFVNSTYLSLLFPNKDQRDFINRPIREALPELEGQGFYEILDQVFRTGKTFNGSKHRALLSQGDGLNRDLYVNFTYQAKYDALGNIDGILVIVYEVTDSVNEQKEIEKLAENLREAITARDTFLGIASHELNTPLTSLKLQTQMYLRLLERKREDAATVNNFSKMLHSTLKQTNRIGLLINDMLDVSRISSGKLTMNLARINISLLLEDVLERFAPQMELAGCNLQTDIDENIYLKVDAGRIEQVITNFVTNAIKYAPGSPVEVQLKKNQGSVILSFKDYGEGISQENHGRIFGRFERANSENDVSGLGLGLFISKQIVHEHGGTIIVESEIGHGAKFSCVLPVTL